MSKYIFRNTIVILISCFIMLSCKNGQDIIPDIVITLSSDSLELCPGDTATIKIIEKDSNEEYIWSSLNPDVAEVVDGLITAKQVGETEIKVILSKYNTIYSICKVKVVDFNQKTELIYSVEDLIKYRDLINSSNTEYGERNYKLMNDLDLSNIQGWTSIGSLQSNSFKGIFNGNNKAIKNLTINTLYQNAETPLGLFGYIENGSVKNLNVDSIKINSQVNYAGAITTYLYSGNITNCNTSGFLNNSNSNAGIAAIAENSTIENCKSTCSLNGSYCGGIVLENNNGTIKGCNYSGSIKSYIAGGICQLLNDGTIENCYTSGTINSVENHIATVFGGIVDRAENSKCIDCHSSSSINHSWNIGGIACYAISSTIESCSFEGNINSLQIGGGIVGDLTGNINKCSFDGKLEAGVAGGIVSSVTSGIVINSYSSGEIKGYINGNNAGGICGLGGEIINCYSSAYIYSNSGYGAWERAYSSGIANNAKTAINCLSSGKIYSRGNESCSCGICTSATDELKNNIAMNDSVISYSSTYYDNNYSQTARITFPASTTIIGVNYAKDNMILKEWTNIISDFSDTNKNGIEIDKDPLTILNNYIDSNPTYNGIELVRWTINQSQNNGYPILDL